MAPGSAQGGDQAGLLQVAQHALGPTGGLSCLLDRHRLHRGEPYHGCVKFSESLPAGRARNRRPLPVTVAGAAAATNAARPRGYRHRLATGTHPGRALDAQHDLRAARGEIDAAVRGR